MPHFTPEMEQRVRNVECAWNTRDVDAIVLGNTIDCHWRNRVNFLWGREQIRTFIERQLRREIDARYIFEIWTEGEARLSLRFVSEFHNDSGTWLRTYGSEELEFDPSGLVTRRLTAANDHPIQEHERILKWPAGPKPSDHPALLELGL